MSMYVNNINISPGLNPLSCQSPLVHSDIFATPDVRFDKRVFFFSGGQPGLTAEDGRQHPGFLRSGAVIPNLMTPILKPEIYE